MTHQFTIKGLPNSATNSAIKEFFNNYNVGVTKVNCIYGPEGFRRIAEVNFPDQQTLETAVIVFKTHAKFSDFAQAWIQNYSSRRRSRSPTSSEFMKREEPENKRIKEEHVIDTHKIKSYIGNDHYDILYLNNVTSAGLESHRFIIAEVNLAFAPRYLPCELSLAIFSLKEGESNRLSALITPNNPSGVQSDAESVFGIKPSTTTTTPKYTQRNVATLWDNIVGFLQGKSDGNLYHLFSTKPMDTWNALLWIARQNKNPSQSKLCSNIRVHYLQNLLQYLKHRGTVAKLDDVPLLADGEDDDKVDDDKVSYNCKKKKYGCDFHVDGSEDFLNKCSLVRARRASALVRKTLCEKNFPTCDFESLVKPQAWESWVDKRNGVFDVPDASSNELSQAAGSIQQAGIPLMLKLGDYELATELLNAKSELDKIFQLCGFADGFTKDKLTEVFNKVLTILAGWEKTRMTILEKDREIMALKSQIYSLHDSLKQHEQSGTQVPTLQKENAKLQEEKAKLQEEIGISKQRNNKLFFENKNLRKQLEEQYTTHTTELSKAQAKASQLQQENNFLKAQLQNQSQIHKV